MKSKWMMICSVGLLACAELMAGSFAGNPTELNDPDAKKAWFPIKGRVPTVCVDVAKNFGFAEGKLRIEFTRAFKSWVDYAKQKRVTGALARYSIPLAESFVFQEKCLGTEDLRILFGETNAEIEKAKVKMDRPLAFAKKTSISPEGWSRGYLWIAPSLPTYAEGTHNLWTLRALRAQLLHEVGHLFGTEHMPGTIMDENLGYVLAPTAGGNFPWYGPGDATVPLDSIDGPNRELVQCGECTYEFLSGPGYPKIQRFKEIVGRAPKGEVTARLVLRGDDSKLAGTFTLKDDLGVTEFSIRWVKQILWRNGTERAFVVHNHDGKPNSTGMVLAEMTRLRDGQKRRITIARNLSWYVAELVDLTGEAFNTLDEDESIFFGSNTYRVIE